MKSILMSIKPYYGFLIIAKAKGWDLSKYSLHEKTIEVRKGVPTSPDWDEKAALYFSKDKKSLARIPEEYRGEVEKLIGKVIGEFFCNEIDRYVPIYFKGQDFFQGYMDEEYQACISHSKLCKYAKGKTVYGLHISDLKIYDKPKSLSEFWTIKCNNRRLSCGECDYKPNCIKDIDRPPQSWCYVEKL